MAMVKARTSQVTSTPPSSDDTVSDSRDVSESFESFPDRVEGQMRQAIERRLRRQQQKICTERQQNAPLANGNMTRGNMRRAVASDPHYLRPYHYDDAIMDCVNVTESMNEHFFHVSIGMNNHDVGSVIGLQPELAICLALSWALLFTCISTGFTITRKKGSLMPLVPISMVVLLMVGTLWESGAGYGLLYLLIPKWEKLVDVTVWSNAVTQLFFSLGLAYGPTLVYGSFNRFYTDIHRATFTVIGLSYVASVMYSTIVFSSLGRLSYTLNIPVENAVHGGQGIMFVAMNKYSMHWMLSSVFFVLVVIAGTTSQVASIEVAMTYLGDLFPTLRFNTKPFALLYCFVGCALGLPLVTEGGLYLLHMMDSQVAGFLLPYVALFELGAVIWIYGIEHLKLDVMLMHGELSAMKLEYAWTIGVPLILAGNIVSSLLTGCSSLRFGPIQYPLYSCYIGWTFIIIGALQVPLWAILASFSGPKRLDQCLLPDSCQEFNLNSQSGSEPLPYQHHP